MEGSLSHQSLECAVCTMSYADMEIISLTFWKSTDLFHLEIIYPETEKCQADDPKPFTGQKNTLVFYKSNTVIREFRDLPNMCH